MKHQTVTGTNKKHWHLSVIFLAFSSINLFCIDTPYINAKVIPAFWILLHWAQFETYFDHLPHFDMVSCFIKEPLYNTPEMTLLWFYERSLHNLFECHINKHNNNINNSSALDTFFYTILSNVYSFNKICISPPHPPKRGKRRKIYFLMHIEVLWSHQHLHISSWTYIITETTLGNKLIDTPWQQYASRIEF